MYANQLRPLLAEGTFVPGSVISLAALSDKWFRDEASLVSFTFRSIFHDLIRHGWDDEQGIMTIYFERFVANVLPRLNAVLASLPGNSTNALEELLLAYGFAHILPAAHLFGGLHNKSLAIRPDTGQNGKGGGARLSI